MYQTKIASLLAQRQPGYSLPQGFYNDPDVYQHDLREVFAKQWLFVGHEVDIAEAGDWFNVDIGDAGVTVLRHGDGGLRAFHNSCRHRGSRLCLGDSGNSHQLVCPYHQWTYDHDGRLVYAKDMGPDFDPAGHGLAPVPVRTCAGLIFLCLADDAPDFAPLAGALEPYLAPHRLREAKVAHRSSIVEEGNWKLVLENNRECYHCGGSHPELCRTYSDDPAMTGVAAGGGSDEIQRHVSKCESLGLPSAFHMAPGGQYRLQRIPLTTDAASYTLSGEVASAKPLVDVDDTALGSLLFFHYPNTWNHFLSDHAVTFVVTPLGPQQTRVTTTWLVHRDAVEDVDYSLEDLTAVWLATNDQDRELVENNQRGVNSPGYQPGPYSPTQEDGVAQFVDWYCERLAASLSASAATEEEAPPIPLPHPSATQPPAAAAPLLPLPTAAPAASATVGATAVDTAALESAAVDTAAVTTADPNSRRMAETVSRIAEAQRESPFVYLENSRPWVDSEQRLKVVSVVEEAPDTKSFTFRPEQGGYFSFAPGQFVTLALPVDGETLYRTYTISSSPSRPMSLSVTVKAQAGSRGTRWMLDQLQVGMTLRAHGPAGQFHLYNHPAEKYLFISAGSGITPMFSMTNFLFDRGSDLDISFVHAARRPSEIILRANVEQWSARVPGLKLAWVVEERDPYSAWSGYTGRFNQLILEMSTPDFYEREVFCCGPAPFMQAVREILEAANFDMRHYHEESFSAPVLDEPEAAAALTPTEPPQAVSVDFSLAGKQIDTDTDTTLLQAAKDAGLNIPSACNFGVCGTCKVKVLSGETQMVHNGGISDAEVEDGYVLACCSRASGNVSLLL